MARGISTPNTVSGPDSCQRITVNDTSDTIELIAPMPSERASEMKVATSCWMRWSGLSMGFLVNRAR
jgi:hypothetical protein